MTTELLRLLSPSSENLSVPKIATGSVGPDGLRATSQPCVAEEWGTTKRRWVVDLVIPPANGLPLFSAEPPDLPDVKAPLEVAALSSTSLVGQRRLAIHAHDRCLRNMDMIRDSRAEKLRTEKRMAAHMRSCGAIDTGRPLLSGFRFGDADTEAWLLLTSRSWARMNAGTSRRRVKLLSRPFRTFADASLRTATNAPIDAPLPPISG